MKIYVEFLQLLSSSSNTGGVQKLKSIIFLKKKNLLELRFSNVIFFSTILVKHQFSTQKFWNFFPLNFNSKNKTFLLPSQLTIIQQSIIQDSLFSQKGFHALTRQKFNFYTYQVWQMKKKRPTCSSYVPIKYCILMKQ